MRFGHGRLLCIPEHRHVTMKRTSPLLALALAAWLIPQVAQAGLITVGFQKVTNNNVEDLSAQLGLTVYDAAMANGEFGLALSGNEVLFAYTNAVGIASSIAEVYIDDGTVVSLLQVENSLGGFTDFAGGSASPGNLPGWDLLDPPFAADEGSSADVDSGSPINGVDQTADILGVSYGTSGGLAGITSAILDGSLRVGLHIRSIGIAGGGDSYLNTGGPTVVHVTVVPEPSSLILFATTAACLVGFGWRRKRKTAA